MDALAIAIVLGSMWLARRGGLIGLLLWPGALFFVLYNYIVYVFAMPLNAAFVLHLALVASSAYTLIGLIAVPRASFVVAATVYGSRGERSNLQCPGRSLLGAGMSGGIFGGRWPNEPKKPTSRNADRRGASGHVDQSCPERTSALTMPGASGRGTVLLR